MGAEGGHRRYVKVLYAMLVFCLAWIVLGFLMDTPRNILDGLRTICLTEDTLITDYLETVGPGAAFVNAGLVCLFSVALLYFSGDPVNGYTFVVMGLMAGFSLFGKNMVNILPIVLGTYLYAKLKGEPFSKYVSVSLLATSLSPMVSYLLFATHEPLMPLVGLLAGLLIGFCMPPLAAYTFRIQNGMNLYNTGFACGVLGMILVPIMTAFSLQPKTVLYWSTGHNLRYGLGLGTVCAVLILGGLLRGGRTALRRYRRMLRTSGRAPSDYLRAFGAPAVCINMGINGLLGIAYILLIGGDLNGPTLGGIITIMGFSAYGKHLLNIGPVMLGVLIGTVANHVPINDSALQLAGLFGTTLAPFSGVFGWPAGVLAGLLHSSVVLQSGLAVAGMNLYNNGFSGGLIAIVLYPILTALVRRRKPTLQDEDFYDLLEGDEPISPKDLDAHQNDDAVMPR